MEHIRLLLLLRAISMYRGERSLNGIIHLLKGKRSTQTIQDGFLFNGLHLFGVMSKVEIADFHKDKEKLEKLTFIQMDKENHYYVTPRGNRVLEQKLEKYPYFEWLNGWEYKDTTKPFWRRLMLLVQTISFITIDEFQFRPVIQEFQTINWVKRIFPKERSRRQNWANQLFKELNHFLDQIQDVYATIFTNKLSGASKVGLTNEQISENLNIPKQEIDIILLAVLHRMLLEVQNNKELYPLLFFTAKDLYHSLPVTQSAKITHDLWVKGYSLSEIATYRRLKQSTIEDHFIEIVIADPTFSIDTFISAELEIEIKEVAKRLGTMKLRPIKEQVCESISYFQIRLVLTKLGGKYDELNS